MSIISFIENAGEKLFGHGAAAPAAPAATAPAAAPAAQPDLATLNATAAAAISKYIGSQHLEAEGLNVGYDGATQTVTVSGTAPDQATREKIVLCCGNVAAVSKVNDMLTVAASTEPPSTYREVKSGDTLSRIAKDAYGEANAYMKIFEANKPMLSDPNKIYPGQMLRIPAKG
jgi:nucleoid-associated protein YgaU